jgi:hypothetical protein
MSTNNLLTLLSCIRIFIIKIDYKLNDETSMNGKRTLQIEIHRYIFATYCFLILGVTVFFCR